MRVYISKYTRPLIFRASLIRISVYPDSESGRPTNEFKQHTPRVLPEMPDTWPATLVNTMFCRVPVKNSAVLNLVNSVNALCILLRTGVSFYLHNINTFALSGLFHYLDRFLHHLVRENEGRV